MCNESKSKPHSEDSNQEPMTQTLTPVWEIIHLAKCWRTRKFKACFKTDKWSSNLLSWLAKSVHCNFISLNFMTFLWSLSTSIPYPNTANKNIMWQSTKIPLCWYVTNCDCLREAPSSISHFGIVGSWSCCMLVTKSQAFLVSVVNDSLVLFTAGRHLELKNRETATALSKNHYCLYAAVNASHLC